MGTVAIVGGGPAGLMAAEVLTEAGFPVDLYDAMPSAGRKFLLAGVGGLNLTHGEAMPGFAARYGARQHEVKDWLQSFGPQELRRWAAALGITTFVGSSGRVFPTDMKAAPLLRAWLHRLREAGVRFHMRHRWLGWADADAHSGGGHGGSRGLSFATPAGEVSVRPDAAVLALGGASWPRLGSDGAWVALLRDRGVDVAAFQPANCGFDVGRKSPDGSLTFGWSDFFRTRHAGQPLKTVAMACAGPDGQGFHQRGEFVVTAGGVEGSLVYAASALLRNSIAAGGPVEVTIDLLPDRGIDFVRAEVARPRGSRSLSTHLKSRLGIDGVKAALLHELLPRASIANPVALAAAIKALPLTLTAPRPVDEAISTAGGVAFASLDEHLMLRPLPGVFCAGEMLDWEAPTGGYLLTAAMASGRRAGQGVLHHLARRSST